MEYFLEYVQLGLLAIFPGCLLPSELVLILITIVITDFIPLFIHELHFRDTCMVSLTCFKEEVSQKVQILSSSSCEVKETLPFAEYQNYFLQNIKTTKESLSKNILYFRTSMLKEKANTFDKSPYRYTLFLENSHPATQLEA